MTPAPAERTCLPMQKPSGGELVPASSPAKASILEAESRLYDFASNAKPTDQTSVGQNETGKVRPAHSQTVTKSSPPANAAGEPSGLAQDDSQSAPLRKDSNHHEPKQHGSEPAVSGSTTVAKDLVEQASLPYPSRPTRASTKPFAKKTERLRVSEARSLGDKKQSHVQPSIRRPNGLSKFQHKALADYAPWDGSHIEDRISELVIKGGYQVKQQVLNEANTARPTLGPHLKNNPGLPNLSTFFTSLLRKRQDNGRVVAPSTFKPPPRVTLTDTKREVWLGELANSAVPLRKLSRTIPHGIRGKILLEQCMAKNVPMARALWLAKCVGANELRAFRRKGISGLVMLENEQKWIKDWTMVLETFIEDLGRLHHQPEWKSKIIYALQLTSRFFADGLLDKDHVLDWALTKLEFAIQEKLPFALLVVQMFAPSITQSLKHGCRLASISLSKLNELSKSPDKDLYTPLLDRIFRLVTNLALQHPNCFLVQRIWGTCRDTFLSIILEFEAASSKAVEVARQESRHNETSALRQVMKKNDQIVQATSRSVNQEEPPVLSLVRKLDSFQPQTNIERIASECLNIVSDIDSLISVLIQWAVSLYREGLYRIFIVIRLIRLWKDEGHDTDKQILRALDTVRHSPGLNPRKLSRLTAELIRAGYFDTARFLRSLISKGGLNDKHRFCDLQILIDMPVSHLQPSVLSLRNMLIRGCIPGHPAAPNPATDVESLINVHQHEVNDRQDSSLDPSTLTWSETFEISESIRRSLLDTAIIGQPSIRLNRNTTTNLGFTAPQLNRFVTILEVIGDVFAIGDFLSTVMPTADVDGLAILIETLERYCTELGAAGATEQLIQAATERYRSLRTTSPPVKRLVLPLYGVSMRLAEDSSTIPYLKRELASCDSNVGIAANTPMSDIQVENASETENELERILAGGTVMDGQRLSQAFEAIISRAAKASHFDQNYPTLTTVVGTLKLQNEERFQEVLAAWLRVKLPTAESAEVGSGVSFLLDAGCVDLATFASIADHICDILASEDAESGLTASIKTLALFFPLSEKANSPYDVRLDVDKLSGICEVNPECALRLLLRLLTSSDNSASRTEVDTLIQSKSLLDGLRYLIVRHAALVCSVLEPSSLLHTPTGADRYKRLMGDLVDPSGELGFANYSDAEQMRFLFKTVDGFSMPFYQLCLKTLNRGPTGSEDSLKCLSASCLEALADSELRDCPMWATLISAMDVHVAQEVRSSAEQLVLIEPSSLEEALSHLRALKCSDVRFWAKAVEATSFSIPEHGEPETGRNIEKHVSLATSLMTGSLETRDNIVQQWLQALCQLAIVHSRSCSGVIKAKMVHGLCSLLARNVGQLAADSVSSVFDATRYFVDDLTPRIFALVRSNLGPLKSDPQIRFLFGIHENTDAWLYVARASSALVAQPAEPSGSTLFPLRRWELLPESAANVGANDTALSLRLFDATKVG